MSEFTATPETGPVDASVSMDSVLAQFNDPAPEKDDAVKSAVDELVKETEDDGQAEAPVPEESATDPIDDAEEPDDGPQDEEPQADEPTHKVKVNGVEIDVSLTELRNGYSRNEDYKAKTMALAEERRTVEAEKATVEQTVRGQYASELTQALDVFERADPILAEARLIDWEALKASDPTTFVQYSDQVTARLEFIKEQRGQITQIAEQQQQAAQEAEQSANSDRFNSAAQAIIGETPELADPAKFQEFAKSVFDYLGSEGFDNAAIINVIDDKGRALVIADKARRYDAMMAAKATLPGKKIVPRSSVKPMATDANSSTRANSPKITSGMSRDDRVSFVLDEFMKD